MYQEFIKRTFVWVIAVLVAGCNANNGKAPQGQKDSLASMSGVDSANFKQVVAGKTVGLYLLKSKNGMQVAITNYGGRVVSMLVPSKDGRLVDVVLGYDSLKYYLNGKEFYFGALIGRYGNRIGKGKFTLSGKPYQLNLNDGPNTLHGGSEGFFKQIWQVRAKTDKSLELSYFSKDGEEGYPGNLNVVVTYTVTDNNELKIAYSATTDKATVINLTNHAYFNLNGIAAAQPITNHLLQINSDAITPVDSVLIPTGQLMPVKGTAFDFNTAKPIGKDIEDQAQQMKYGKGYDHNFVLNKHADTAAVVTLSSPLTGIEMKVFTSEPGIQFYSGNFLKAGGLKGKGGTDYAYRSGLCLETQHFPDAPNHPEFPLTVLMPGKTYHSATTYSFSIK